MSFRVSDCLRQNYLKSLVIILKVFLEYRYYDSNFVFV